MPRYCHVAAGGLAGFFTVHRGHQTVVLPIANGGNAICQMTAMWLQVGLLDPVQYPGGIKAFAKEVCKNDLLNFGRLHFFFPDSRLALDLNTDKTLKVG